MLLSLQNLQASEDLKEGLTCQILPEGEDSALTVPFGEVLYFEIAPTTKHIHVSFLKQEKEVAKGTLVVPKDVASNLEVETTEVMKSSSSQNGGSTSDLYAEFNMTFINSDAAATSAKKSAAASKTTPKKVASVAAFNTVNSSAKKSPSKTGNLGKSVSSISGLNQVLSKVDTGIPKVATRSNSKERAVTPVAPVESFLNKVVSKHQDEVNQRVTADMQQTGDSVYLNRFNQVATSSLINAGALGASRREGSRDSREETELDQTASPEKLRDKFRFSSKSPSKYGPDMASILMDTESRRYVNEFKNQLEYLRNIVYVLDLKNNSLDSSKREADQLREEAEKANAAREELRKTLLETTRDLKQEGDNMNHLIIDMETQNKELVRDLKASNNKVDDLQTKLHAQEVRNAQLESQLDDARAKAQTGDVYKAQLEKLINDHAASERRYVETLNALGSRLADLEDSLQKVTRDRQNLRDENIRLGQSMAEIKMQLAQEKLNNVGLRDDLESLNNKLKLGQTSIDVYQAVQQLKEGVLGEVNKMQGIAQNFVRGVQDNELQEQSRRREFQDSARLAREDADRASRRSLDLEAQVSELRATAAKSRRDNIELRNHIITLEQLLCVKEDVYSQLESATARLESRQNDCDNFRSQLDAASKVTESLTEKVLELEKMVIYLKNSVVDKDDVRLVSSTVHSQLEETHHRTERQKCSVHCRVR